VRLQLSVQPVQLRQQGTHQQQQQQQEEEQGLQRLALCQQLLLMTSRDPQDVTMRHPPG
jgi:hypothetical protein